MIPFLVAFSAEPRFPKHRDLWARSVPAAIDSPESTNALMGLRLDSDHSPQVATALDAIKAGAPVTCAWDCVPLADDRTAAVLVILIGAEPPLRLDLRLCPEGGVRRSQLRMLSASHSVRLWDAARRVVVEIPAPLDDRPTPDIGERTG